MTFLLQLENLTTQFGNHVVHNNLNIGFKQGEVTAIIGPSGSGKSTLIEFITAETHTSKGKMYWKGKPWYRENIANLIGYAPQRGGFIDDFTIIENIALPLIYVCGFSESLAKDVAWAVIQNVGLGENVYYQYPYTLSGGMLRRASIARAMVLEQKLLILDEPLSGLDLQSLKEIMDLIISLTPVFTIICITHHFIPAHKYVMIHNGNVIEGTYSTMIKHPIVKEFLREI